MNITHLEHPHLHHNRFESKYVHTLSSDLLNSFNILLLYLPPLSRVFTITYMKQIICLRYTVLQPFCTCKWATGSVISHVKYVVYCFVRLVLLRYYYFFIIFLNVQLSQSFGESMNICWFNKSTVWTGCLNVLHSVYVELESSGNDLIPANFSLTT